MAINQNRPVISYENIALLQSSAPAYSEASNSLSNVSFLPLVQGIDVSIDFPRNKAGQVGSKEFINQSFQNAPDVNLTINTYEDFSELFAVLFDGSSVREDLDEDRNFYAIINDRRGIDIGTDDISGKQILSFGNCFLNGVSISQSVNGIMQSSYNFVGSNMQAQEIIYEGTTYSGENPALDLTGNQIQNLVFEFDDLSGDYYNTDGSVIPSFTTNVLISGNGSTGNLLIHSESIQSFDLNLNINRKSIYSLGKKHPVKRKALFPSEGAFSFSNKTEDFFINGDRGNLADFLSYDEFYTIYVSGQKNNSQDFLYKIENAKIENANLSNSIGSNSDNSISFFFNVMDFKQPPIIGYEVSESEMLGGSYNGTYVIGEPTGDNPSEYSTAYYYGDYIIGKAYKSQTYLAIYYLDVIGDADAEIIQFSEDGSVVPDRGLFIDENVIIVPIYF